jgi:CRP-like cAMP-binding protein
MVYIAIIVRQHRHRTAERCMCSRQNCGGHMSHIEQSNVRNGLLAALPPDDFALLAGSLKPVTLELKRVLYEPDQPIESVYFIESGSVSMLSPIGDGDFAEVGLVGREGLVGLPVVLGDDSSTTETLVQMPGVALRVQEAALKEALDRSAGLRRLLLRYAQAFHNQVTQTAGCNSSHTLDERLARWLLMVHDRAEGDTFPMTQEFMSMMLGVRRAGVSVTANVLQKAGAITYHYGTMTVTDRAILKGAACKCYGIMRQQFERLLGQTAVYDFAPLRPIRE